MRGSTLSAPMYHLLERPARRTLVSGASETAIGGFCLKAGVHRRYNPDPAEQSRFYGWAKAVAGVNDIFINVLKRLGMVVSAWVLVSPCVERPSTTVH